MDPRPASTPPRGDAGAKPAHPANVRLVPVSWDEMAGWRSDDPALALAALRRSADHVLANGPHRSGSLGIAGEALIPAMREALGVSDERARSFFEGRFTPYRIEGTDLGGPDGRGFVTGFYEPTIEASGTRSDRYPHAIHARPPALRKNDGTRPLSTLPRDYAWGWQEDDAGPLAEAPSRPEIETAALQGRLDLARWPVIAWARDRVDLFFAHIQGAARLAMEDGSVRRITYAAKTGHPFTAIGAELLAEGELRAGEVTMASIRQWLAGHPDRVDELLRRNRSYIFFREEDGGSDDPALGPVAAGRVPLTPGRSLAVDRLRHTFGTPIHVSAPALSYPEGAPGTGVQPFARLMIAQETGTAIVGAARGDIFTGSGEAAGALAGGIAHGAEFTVLAPADWKPPRS